MLIAVSSASTHSGNTSSSLNFLCRDVLKPAAHLDKVSWGSELCWNERARIVCLCSDYCVARYNPWNPIMSSRPQYAEYKMECKWDWGLRVIHSALWLSHLCSPVSLLDHESKSNMLWGKQTQLCVCVCVRNDFNIQLFIYQCWKLEQPLINL